jgi:mono/diheme cytochrome c family protein
MVSDDLFIEYACLTKGYDMKKMLWGMWLTFMMLATLGAGAVYSGVISVAADDPHWGWVYEVFETARDRSIEFHSSAIQAPLLDDEAMIVAGAGNYASMCASCHLAPGVSETELSRGLYPSPPNFAASTMSGEPHERFWVIKHGIKASGMPAWGQSMQDEYIWQMVAFMEELPDMSAARYTALVAASDGHQHGGGETTLSQSSHHADGVGELPHDDGHHDALQESPAQESHGLKSNGDADGHSHAAHDQEHQH